MQHSASHDSPLVDVGPVIRFDLIAAEHVGPAIDALVARAQANIDAIGEVASPTYANTFGALDEASADLEMAYGLVSHLEGVTEDAALRAAYNDAQPHVSRFFSSIPLNAALYRSLRAFAETAEAKALDPTRARFVEKTLDEFRRNGAELGEADKARLREVEIRLAETTNRFSQNVSDGTDAFAWVTTDPTQLAGLPESVLTAAAGDAAAAGVEGWRFTLHGPSMVPLMTYLDSGDIREHFYRAFNARSNGGDFDNRGHLAQILELRREKASILGYKDVADLHLAPRMVKTGHAAQRFVDTLRGHAAHVATEQHEALQAFRQGLEGTNAAPLAAWDLAYYAEKQRLGEYDFDSEALRPYFAVDRALGGIFEVCNRLYGVEIIEIDDLPTWHPSVRSFALEEDGRRTGIFFIDLFPRVGKRGGAWMYPLLVGDPANGRPHVGVVCANMTPPTADGPALLRHREMETLFHEFGHLMHHLLTRVEVRSLAGTNVAWDFVELPSQIMENWCWERDTLDVFARHYETDDTIPEGLFGKMTQARAFRGAYQVMRQLEFAAVDLALHRDFDAQTDGSVLDYARRISSTYHPTELIEDYAMIAGFQHLFANPVGYAAGYYSYKWAEVLEADAFSRFADEGLFSREVGQAFREKILQCGDSRDPMDLFVDFMGREPDQRALLVRSGLVR